MGAPEQAQHRLLWPRLFAAQRPLQVAACYGCWHALGVSQGATILKKFNYTDVKSASTPVDLEKPLVKDGDAELCACARFQVTLNTSHLLAVKRSFRYLKGKPTFALCKKQTVVAISTTEAEYVAAASCCGHIYNKSYDAGRLQYLSSIKINTAKQENALDCVFLGFGLTLQDKKIEYLMLNASPLKHVKRGWDTKIPQSSGPSVKVGDEAVHKELGDRMERAATTASSLEAEQDSYAQTRFETTSKQSNDLPLLRVNTLGSGKNNMKLIELMAHYTTLFALNALTECPTLYASLIEQFWQTAALSTNEDEVKGITATIDRKVKVIIFEASIRRHLKLEDSEGLKTLPTVEMFEQLALMGYVITSDSLTFQKGHFFPQWKFFIHIILHCLSPKKTAWEQFSSNIATAIICLATNRTFNFSNLIFKAMAAPMPHESPLQSVHSLGRDEGSLSLHELTDLCTSLSKKVASLESELKQTKQTYNAALTKLIKRGRSLIEELNLDTGISLVPPHAADQGKIDDTQISEQLKSIRRREVSNGSGGVSTASRLVSTADISTATELDSTAGVKAKDKGKAIMHESEPPKKIKKRVQVQISVDEELAKKVFEEEQARFNTEQEARFKAEQEQEMIDFETALKLQKQLDEREEVAAKVDQPHDIDWSDPAVLRYHTLQNRPFSVAEEVMKRSGFNLQQESLKLVEEEIVQQDDVIAEQAVKEGSRTAGGRRKKLLARKRAKETLSEESAKKQKLEDDTEKEELQVYLNIVPEEESLNIESLATKYPIVDWETQILANDKYYYQIKRTDGSVKHYKIFSALLYDFDRQDMLELYRLVKENFQTASPEGYDLLL
ncbi:hypothetical protein Tco_0057631 [Tanacetum coccineum]